MVEQQGNNLFSKGYALIIGAGGDLPNTVTDAQGLAAVLLDNGRCAYPPQHVTCLTAEKATRPNIISALDELARRTNKESTVIIYFSGHGYQVQSNVGQVTFLMPYGYDVNDLLDTAVDGRELAHKLQAIKAQKLLLLLDCCHAGGLDQAKLPGLDVSKTPLPVAAETFLSQGNGRVLIASSRENELSFAGRPYSAFTHALLEALCGVGASKQDGYVRVADLALHTRQMVPERTQNRQHPILNFEQADNFVLAYYAGGSQMPKALPFPKPTIENEENLQETTAQYLKMLIDRYQHLDFKGMGVSSRIPLRLPLLQLYVPLKARTELPEGDTWDRTEANDTNIVPGESVALLPLLQHHDGLVVLGDPGAGKTTFLRYLALTLALGLPLADHLNNRLPLVLSLSAYADALTNQNIALDKFLAQFYRSLGLNVPIEKMITAALNKGQALLLLDGLDEIADPNLRQRLTAQIRTFYDINRRKGNKFVFTSRIVGYRQTRLMANNLVECTLADFTEQQVERFVYRWTSALETAVQGQSNNAIFQAKQQADELLAAIQRNPGIRQLSANPLLLTILALMKRQGIILPERRIELYENYLRTLLTQWNLARGLDRASARNLDMIDIMHILAPLALWMHETSPSGVVHEQQLRQKLVEIFRQRGQKEPEQAARQFLADTHEYAGLLVERGPGMYGFLHLTFQEYATAVAIVQSGQSDIEPVLHKLRQHMDDPNWHEVILLTIGYLGLQQQRDEAATKLVLDLLNDDNDHQAPILMGEAAISILPSGLTHEGYTAVVKHLHRTMRNDANIPGSIRVQAGALIASLGDPRDEVLEVDAISFCFVPGGDFWLGQGQEKTRYTGLVHSFWISQFPVTNAHFTAFMAAGGYQNNDFWAEATAVDRWQDGKTKDWELNEWRSQPQNFGYPFQLPNHPVVGITWYEALAFTRWLTAHWQQSGLIAPGWTVTLPSEVEWEKAARGGLHIPANPLIEPIGSTLIEPTFNPQENPQPQRPYPWGNRLTTDHANYRRTDVETTNAVGCFAGGASPYGCEEMCGNVWEWTRSKHASYPYDPADGREQPDIKLYEQVALRGGAFWNKAHFLSCSERAKRSPNDQSGSYSFRLVIVPV